MARTKEKAPSFASVIRGYFEENPDWLEGPSNQALIERYLKDHPGEQWTKKHQQGAANESRVTRVRPSAGALEQLELLIDDCLSLAARQNNPALENTVKHLRVAR